MTRDVELHGQTIAKGQKLLLLYPSANRDETVFDAPEHVRRRPARPNDHMAFGFGSHFCLGNRLARMELAVMFDRLLERLPDLALASDDEPPKRAANFVSGYETMPVTFTPDRAGGGQRLMARPAALDDGRAGRGAVGPGRPGVGPGRRSTGEGGRVPELRRRPGVRGGRGDAWPRRPTTTRTSTSAGGRCRWRWSPTTPAGSPNSTSHWPGPSTP